ncbi:NRDE-2, necessary for RNA interference-domain-containing protein [Hyaloraphidium curvatum]|nr:NRDE-2, necessary for RNA interference-domain-containing protein [Hyaloraphidium curvatum]
MCSFPTFGFDIEDSGYERDRNASAGSRVHDERRQPVRSHDAGTVVATSRDSRRDSDRRERHRRSDDGSVQHGDRGRKRRRERSRSPGPLVPARESTNAKDFRFDKRRDYSNLAMETPNRSSVPRFFRAGGPFVLGAPEFLSFAFDGGASAGPVRAAKDVNRQATRRRFVALREALRGPSSRLRKVPDTSDGHAEFVPLDLGPDVDVSMEELNEQQQAAFRKESESLGKRLIEDSKDYRTWKALLDLQDRLAGTSTRGSSYRLVIAEKKLAICERAFVSLPDHDGLWLEYLKIGTAVWDTQTVLTNWDRALAAAPNSYLLVLEYLAFRQTNAATFNCSECVEAFGEFLQRQLPKESAAARKLTRAKIYAFARVCYLLRESGYVERAIAAIQAMLEVTFRRPPSLGSSGWQGVMDAFEDFFESSSPRFGDHSSAGWASFAATTGSTPDDADDDLPSASEGPSDDEDDWWEAEQRADSGRWVPKRAATNVRDPNAIVVMEDVRPLLFPVHGPALQAELLTACLRFLGLPVTVGWDSTSDLEHDDPFLCNSIADELISADLDSIAPNLAFVASYPQTEDYAAYRDPPFAWTAEAIRNSRMLQRPGTLAFASNLLQQVLAVSDALRISLCAILLAFEFALSPKRGSKLAKQMLKVHRDDISLWAAYAGAEKAFGRPDDARNVLIAAIQLGQSMGTAADRDLARLVFSLADLELTARRKEAALSAIVHLALGKHLSGPEALESVPSPPQVLKARKIFAQRHADVMGRGSLEGSDASHAARLVAIRGWLEYLAEGLDDACAVFSGALQALRSSGRSTSFLSELLFQEYLRLLLFHERAASSGRLGESQKVLQEALALFPKNTAFLGLYFEGSSAVLASRSRWSFDIELKREMSSFFVTAYPVVAELQSQSRNANLVRTLLGNCIERQRSASLRSAIRCGLTCSSNRPSSALWMVFIRFELSQGRFSDAKQLFWRAVRECPWSKDLYMMPFNKKLDMKFTTAELEEVWTLMSEEKEIRVRVLWRPEDGESDDEAISSDQSTS